MRIMFCFLSICLCVCFCILFLSVTLSALLLINTSPMYRLSMYVFLCVHAFMCVYLCVVERGCPAAWLQPPPARFRWIPPPAPPPACPDLWLCRRSCSLLTQIWGWLAVRNNRWQSHSLICGFISELHKFLLPLPPWEAAVTVLGKFSSQELNFDIDKDWTESNTETALIVN